MLLDLRLPKLNGFEVVEKIKENGDRFPVIAQTAFAMPEDRKKSLDAGFDDFLTKPVNPNVLFNLFNKYLSK